MSHTVVSTLYLRNEAHQLYLHSFPTRRSSDLVPRARVRVRTKRELRRIEDWSFISRPHRRFEFGPNADASELKEPQLTPRKNSYKGFLADGAWTESDSPLTG